MTTRNLEYEFRRILAEASTTSVNLYNLSEKKFTFSPQIKHDPWVTHQEVGNIIYGIDDKSRTIFVRALFLKMKIKTEIKESSGKHPWIIPLELGGSSDQNLNVHTTDPEYQKSKNYMLLRHLLCGVLLWLKNTPGDPFVEFQASFSFSKDSCQPNLFRCAVQFFLPPQLQKFETPVYYKTKTVEEEKKVKKLEEEEKLPRPETPVYCKTKTVEEEKKVKKEEEKHPKPETPVYCKTKTVEEEKKVKKEEEKHPNPETPVYCKTKTVEEVKKEEKSDEEEEEEEKSSVVRKVFDFVPIIGPILEFRDGVKNIKKGNKVGGCIDLASGIVDLGLDVCSLGLLSFAKNIGKAGVKKVIKGTIKSRVKKSLKKQGKTICKNIVKTAVKRGGIELASKAASYTMERMNKQTT